MRHLIPALQHYAWGSKSYIQQLISQPEHEIIAELWLGAHPKAPARIDGVGLDSLIAQDPESWLENCSKPSKPRLPYLLKILAADEPLSIQVHPDKAQAERGFANEEALSIPLDDPHRNYKDDNHKPELIMALTPFDALCGIRDFPQIVEIFEHCALGAFFTKYPQFKQMPNLTSFTELYKEILSAGVQGLDEHILKLGTLGKWDAEFRYAQKLIGFYPADPFVIAPFIMNLICLKPQTAMFLPAGIPHAYLKGAGVEIMAASDNVLRAGLTPKHIDKDELLTIARLEPYKPHIISVPLTPNELHYYPTPAEDFCLATCTLEEEVTLSNLRYPAIILCLKGDFVLQSAEQRLPLSQGEAAIITARDGSITAKGAASFVLAGPG